jgi:hypothetical protein
MKLDELDESDETSNLRGGQMVEKIIKDVT